MSLTIRALLFIWPFLKRGLFGDLTLKEVVLENLHITVVYLCAIALAFMMVYACIELNVVKSEKIAAPIAVCVKPDDIDVAETLLLRRRAYGEILK